MKKNIVFIILLLLLIIHVSPLHAQSTFTEIKLPGLEPTATNGVTAMIQDRQGYLWILTRSKGLYKYDGSHYIAYTHNDKDSYSVNAALLETMAIDSNDIIWIGTLGGGLDRLDPLTGKVTHFKHQLNNPGSLAHDTVASVLVDHENNVWIGTYRGLDLYDRSTGKFIHHAYDKNNAASISSNQVRVIYEDKEGVLWVGCGSPFTNENTSDNGGLNRFDKRTEKFIRYLHNPNDPASISNNQVRAILEDSKGNFWIGTSGDGLQTLNRQTGVFTHYYYDSTHPEKLSRGPVVNVLNTNDHITFIKEDTKGNIWIGTFFAGITEYNLQTKKITHYGFWFRLKKPNDLNSVKLIRVDTTAGFKNNQAWTACSTKEGLVWIATINGNIYQTDDSKKIILPFTDLHNGIGGNSFYEENDSTLWIATAGLIKRNTRTGKEKIYLHNDHNTNSLATNDVSSVQKDNNGNLWLGTNDGLDKFDPVTENFIHYRATDTTGLSENNILYMHIDHEQNLWIGTNSGGLNEMNIQTGKFSHFRHNDADSSSLSSKQVLCIAEDSSHIWAATANGLNRITKSNNTIQHFLKTSFIKAVFTDATGVVWAGTTDSIYYFDKRKNDFAPFNNINVPISGVSAINGDSYNNLWITTTNDIFKIDSKRENVTVYTAANGVHPNTFLFCNNITTKADELLLGDQVGYYHFFSKDVDFTPIAPYVHITSFKIGNKEVEPGTNSVLDKPLYLTNTIKLAYDQNSLAIGFSSILFRSKNNERYIYKMENYDNTWHDVSVNNMAYFFSLPPGKYIFRARAINADGGWAEKDLSIIISPPWYETWQFRMLSVIALAIVIYSIVQERSKKLKAENLQLEQKVNERTAELKKSLEELKAAQAQLIQSEKMASLGELTAGIAHEIQNPLNFVNNFSEVNKEMIAELKEEIDKGNYDEAKIIADDIEANEEKINHHGKRADAIVKGMLQHSRTSSGQKELTDINALTDEYLRLAYHGLRAKDKSFNAKFETDFDNTIEKIKIIPQDIGRVILNLINNAFYAVNEKLKAEGSSYVPTVTVVTKKLNNSIEIKVKDNGSGIPNSIKEKIFQPFFTTKPTGQGTGLGLSLSYDIIKAHVGEIKMESNEGEGTTFIIKLPV